MKFLICLAGFLAYGKIESIVRTHSDEEYWAGWKEFHSLESVKERTQFYSTKDEHDTRFEIFKDNMEKIKQHSNGGHSWTMGITQFSDMTPREFKEYIACGAMKHTPSQLVFDAPQEWNKTTATSVDWVAKGAVTPVKNQGSCGSCWAFSTTGAIEGRYFIAKGQLNSLSEQDLVDCSTQNSGCNGGLMDYGFEFVESNGGLCSEADYPYIARRHFFGCQENGCTMNDPIRNYQDVTASTSALEAAVTAGPVSVAIEADQSSFQQYTGGVLTASCGSSLDHGVLTVGFGTDGSNDYWKVKNSWGSDWGENGYIRLCRNCNANRGKGQCGILTSASYPIV